ncbi:metallophosphoesterase [Planctomycetota bacterium]
MKRRDFLTQIGLLILILTALGRVQFALGQAMPEDTIDGSIALGCPTDRSIKINLLLQADCEVILEYGKASGLYPHKTQQFLVQAHIPFEIELTGLDPNTQYYYHVLTYNLSGAIVKKSPEYRFHTQRLPGNGFSFCVQGDSHPERSKKTFDAQLYDRTLRTALSDRPDFYIMMGDDFSVDTIKPVQINANLVTERYLIQRDYLKPLSHSTPLYLVNGNHEHAARYLLDGTPNNIAVWAQTARNRYYPQPKPDDFYTGNEEPVEFIGHLENYFAWTWGDALFVAIDPYWSSPIAVDGGYGVNWHAPAMKKKVDKWQITLGEKQYRWLQKTLAESQAKWKFVFAHHVNGSERGGVEVAHLYEWGGENKKGHWEFDKYRPNWELPIHQLMVKHGVTIFFQGHDHVFARQELDGVTYVTTPYPADPTYAALNATRFVSGDVFGGSGYARVVVDDNSVQVEYIRTFLPDDENTQQVNGQVEYNFKITKN